MNKKLFFLLLLPILMIIPGYAQESVISVTTDNPSYSYGNTIKISGNVSPLAETLTNNVDSSNTQKVLNIFLSEKYFFVYEIDEKYNIAPITGGVMYKEEYQMFNMTDIIIRELGETGDIVWIEDGKLNDSNNLFWFTWNLTSINTNIMTGVWVWDGEKLIQEIDPNTYWGKLIIQ